MTEPTGRYDEAYYKLMASHGTGSAAVIAPALAWLYDPKSVVDVGCSGGYFLNAFKELHVDDLHGVDGPFNDGRLVRSAGHPFTAVDLQGGELALGRRFDMALCLETAEHIDERYADALVAGLVDVADRVVFSAAVPGQYGEGHVNCQPQSYWAEKFASHSLRPNTQLRELLWADDRVSWWYRQNVLVFEAGEPEARPLDVIHPGMVREILSAPRPSPTGRESMKGLSSAIARRVGGGR